MTSSSLLQKNLPLGTRRDLHHILISQSPAASSNANSVTVVNGDRCMGWSVDFHQMQYVSNQMCWPNTMLYMGGERAWTRDCRLEEQTSTLYNSKWVGMPWQIDCVEPKDGIASISPCINFILICTLGLSLPLHLQQFGSCIISKDSHIMSTLLTHHPSMHLLPLRRLRPLEI